MNRLSEASVMVNYMMTIMFILKSYSSPLVIRENIRISKILCILDTKNSKFASFKF